MGHDPARGGLTRPPDNESGPGTSDSQNQTVHLLPPGMCFGFRVYFDNLRREELGALLFALTLHVPPDWITPSPPGDGAAGRPATKPALWHLLGHGKPLGMGRCSIALERLHLDSFDPTVTVPGHRYARVPDFQPLPPLTAPASPSERTAASTLCDEYLKHFYEGWDLASNGGTELRKVREQLVEMLRVLDDGVPIHYPPRSNGRYREVEHFENYTWFVANRGGREGSTVAKRQFANIYLPDPVKERNERDSRLPIDPTRP